MHRSRTINIFELFKRSIACNEEIADAYYGIACVYLLRGKKKLALQFLEKSFEKGFKDLYRIETDADMRTIRDDQGWKILKERYN